MPALSGWDCCQRPISSRSVLSAEWREEYLYWVFLLPIGPLSGKVNPVVFPPLRLPDTQGVTLIAIVHIKMLNENK